MKVIVSVFNNLFTDQRVAKVCATLCADGNDVHLIGSDWLGLPQMDRPYAVTHLPLKSKVLRYAYLEYQWKLYRKLITLAGRDTILVANDLDTLLPNYLVSRKMKIPLVFDSHEIFTEMPSLTGRFTQKLWRSLESFIVPNLRYMMTASESYADWFAKTYEIERPAVVQNFPRKRDSEQNYHAINATRIIMYQGAINPYRGLNYIIPAMAQIDAELWIAGEGPKKEEYQHLAISLGLEGKVKFLGNIEPEELRAITKTADLGLSIEENNGLSYFYSLPNKIADYVQARIPVVVSDFPEMRRVVDEFQVGEKIADYSELVPAIRKVLQHGKCFYENTLECAAQQLCWENEEHKLLALYHRVKTENF